ncbi:MAG: DUF4270 family protein, partial [Sphingobacteriales bacterium]|nr:DUF4270 family protein [Sphingobacteriales bacterium]
MKSKLLQKRFPFIIIAVVLLAYGCTKIDTTSIGSGLLPIVDNVNTFDTTLEVSVRNYTDLQSDSVYVYPGTAHIIGQTNDPVFGTTKSNMYFQIAAGSYPFTFPVKSDSLHFDSAVLVLKLAAIYGDTLTPQKIDVFPVTEDTFSYFKYTTSGATGKDTIIVRGAYRINQDIKYDQSRLLGTTTVMPADVRAQRKLSNKIDSVVSSELRIRLDDAFGLSFFTDAVNGAYTSDSAFKKFFNGFAVVPDVSAGGNALMYFLSSTDTKLQLYHRVDKRDGTKDTTVQAFSFNSGNCRIANYVIRDRSAAEVAGHLDNNTDDQVMYLQGTPGTLARV